MVEKLEAAGLRFVGKDETGRRMEVLISSSLVDSWVEMALSADCGVYIYLINSKFWFVYRFWSCQDIHTMWVFNFTLNLNHALGSLLQCFWVSTLHIFEI